MSAAAAASAVATFIGAKVFETRAHFAAEYVVPVGVNSRFAMTKIRLAGFCQSLSTAMLQKTSKSLNSELLNFDLPT